MIGDTLTYKTPARKRHDRGNGDTVPSRVLDLVVIDEKNGYTRCREVGQPEKGGKVYTFQTPTFRELRRVGTELKRNESLAAENAELRAKLAALQGDAPAGGVDPASIAVGGNEEAPAKGSKPAKAPAKGSKPAKANTPAA